MTVGLPDKDIDDLVLVYIGQTYAPHEKKQGQKETVDQYIFQPAQEGYYTLKSSFWI